MGPTMCQTHWGAKKNYSIFISLFIDLSTCFKMIETCQVPGTMEVTRPGQFPVKLERQVASQQVKLVICVQNAGKGKPR